MSKFDKPMMGTAREWADLSSCERRKVGAVLAKGNRPLNTGYNGTISGTDNNCEKSCESCNGKGFTTHYDNDVTCEKCQGKGVITNQFVVHAEKNLIAFCAKEGIPTDGCTVYVTLMPCVECASLMVQAGIKKVIYDEDYRDDSGVQFLKGVGVEVEKFVQR